jgi:hypothetical protein
MALRGVTGDTSPARARANPLPHARISLHRHVPCAHLATCAPIPLPCPDPFVEFRHDDQAPSGSPRHAEPTSRNPTAAPMPRAHGVPSHPCPSVPTVPTLFPFSDPPLPLRVLRASAVNTRTKARQSAQKRAKPRKRRRPRGMPRASRESWQRGRRWCSRCRERCSVKETQQERATVSSR